MRRWDRDHFGRENQRMKELMSEPLEILEAQNKNGETLTWEIRRDGLQIFRQECPVPPNYHESKVNNDLSEPLHGGDASVNPTSINRKQLAYDMETNSTTSSANVNYIQRNLAPARLRSEQQRLIMMFFSFCDPLCSKV